MKDTEINVAIEEILGRVWVKRVIKWDYAAQKTVCEDVNLNEKGIDVYWFCNGRRTIVEPKDYCGSLDAMHEAEKALSDGQYDIFEQELARVAGFVCHDEWPAPSGLRKVISATAKQRAEAFLRTYDKWID
jgi:hypothetical protein